MLIRLLPLVAGLVPVVAIHGAYFLALDAGMVPACIPYLDGCTSISSTGRHAPASYLFKAAMMPESLLLAGFWIVSVAWLRALQRRAGQPEQSGVVVAVLGTGGALCLVVYVTFLGSSEPFYEFMRRFGVYLYFAFTVFAQLGLAWKVARLAAVSGDVRLGNLARWQLGLCIVPFVLGITNLVLKAVLDDSRQVENVIEWVFALLMQVYYLLAWQAWRHTGFTARFSVQPSPAQNS